MKFKDLLKFNKRVKEPKEMREQNIRFFRYEPVNEFVDRKERPRKMDWIDKNDKICRDMERAGARKDKREIGGWLKAFAKEDAKEMRRFEREMAKE